MCEKLLEGERKVTAAREVFNFPRRSDFSGI